MLRIARFIPQPPSDVLRPDGGASHTARALMSLARRSRFEALKRVERATHGEALATLRRVALAHLPGDPYVVSDVLADPWVAEPLDQALGRAGFIEFAAPEELALARALRGFVDRATLPEAFLSLVSAAAPRDHGELVPFESALGVEAGPDLHAELGAELARTLAYRIAPGGPPRLRVGRLESTPTEAELRAESTATKVLALNLVAPLVDGDERERVRALVERCAQAARDGQLPRASLAELRAWPLTEHGRALVAELASLG